MTSNDWIDHDGKGMPVDGKKLVDVKFRDGKVHERTMTAEFWHEDEPDSSNWCFVAEPPDAHIVAYRVVSDV